MIVIRMTAPLNIVGVMLPLRLWLTLALVIQKLISRQKCDMKLALIIGLLRPDLTKMKRVNKLYGATLLSSVAL